MRAEYPSLSGVYLLAWIEASIAMLFLDIFSITEKIIQKMQNSELRSRMHGWCRSRVAKHVTHSPVKRIRRTTKRIRKLLTIMVDDMPQACMCNTLAVSKHSLSVKVSSLDSINLGSIEQRNPERIEGLWVVCSYRGGKGNMPLVEKKMVVWRKNRVVEQESFIDSTRVKRFCKMLFQLSVFPWCREKPQIVMLWVGWMGRLKWGTRGLEPSFFFSFQNRRTASLLPTTPM